MIYQLLIRHAEQFYESRDHFIPQIVFSLPKLGLSPNATAETRTLTIDVAETLLKWETQAIKEFKEKNGVDPGKFSILYLTNLQTLWIGHLQPTKAWLTLLPILLAGKTQTTRRCSSTT